MKCRIASREPVGIGVDRGRGDGDDARALSPAHHAIVGLPTPQRRHALEVDDGVETELGQALALFGPGARLRQKFVGAIGLPVEIVD